MWVADVGSGPTRKCKALPEVSPTLTRSRCKLGGHMLLPMKRYMTLVELEELQGFPARPLWYKDDALFLGSMVFCIVNAKHVDLLRCWV